MPLKINDSFEIAGGGGFGLVVKVDDNSVVKLIRDVNTFTSLEKESDIQKKAYDIIRKNFNGELKVPKINNTYTNEVKYRGKSFLCGIHMNLIEPLFLNTQFHIALGYNGDDIDTIWKADEESNRGLYGSLELLEDIYNDEEDISHFNQKYKDMGYETYIKNIAFLIGRGYRSLILNGINPIDLEWVIDKYGDLWIIDFGLCKMESVDLDKKLNDSSWSGLANDIYIPRKGSFLRPYFDSGYFGVIKAMSMNVKY